jgi:hypothetical protein
LENSLSSSFRKPIYKTTIQKYGSIANSMIRTRGGLKPTPGKYITNTGPGDYKPDKVNLKERLTVIHGASSAFKSKSTRTTIIPFKLKQLNSEPEDEKVVKPVEEKPIVSSSSFKTSSREYHNRLYIY